MSDYVHFPLFTRNEVREHMGLFNLPAFAETLVNKQRQPLEGI